MRLLRGNGIYWKDYPMSDCIEVIKLITDHPKVLVPAEGDSISFTVNGLKARFFYEDELYEVTLKPIWRKHGTAKS